MNLEKLNEFLKKIFGLNGDAHEPTPPSQINPLADRLESCNQSLLQIQADKDKLRESLVAVRQNYATLKEENERMVLEIEEYRKAEIAPHPKEIYWNTKYPEKIVKYGCRYVMNGNEKVQIPVDVRTFFQRHNDNVRFASVGVSLGADKSNDNKALEALKWVMKNIRYTSDEKIQGVSEFWQYPDETLKLGHGDCEDGSILLANIMLVLGIPYWRVHLNAGSVKGGGHAYVTYCRETDDEFVTLDWCYWPETIPVAKRKLHREMRDYYGIDWSWTDRQSFSKYDYENNEGKITVI